jgi:indolepyruvate ferredoxin oxidoreductase, alpha subunit
MKKMLLLGDEAVGQGAIDAGISTAFGYPGTPSTEILEYLERMARTDKSFVATWAANEKVAYEQAIGTSFAGRRGLVTMKHVGLNVAADPFMNSAVTGAAGGVVLAVADDPSMHSSQNEQDSRFYADFAMVPCFEPANQQDCYDMTREAFEVSERFELPVLLRIVTRLAHSRADVEIKPRRECNPLRPSKDRSRWTLLPSNARVQYEKLLKKQPAIKTYSEQSELNRLYLDPSSRKLGVVTAGVGYNYFREIAGPNPPSYLKLGVYPIPEKKVRKLLEHVDTLLIIEEGYPFIEKQLFGLLGEPAGKQVRGRASGHVPAFGELTPETVARALGQERTLPVVPKDLPVLGRPPQLCTGCPHRDTFLSANIIRETYPDTAVFSDIGCYTLGYYPPFNAIDSCLDMGASISMAKGASDAGMHPVMCVIGDSTFGHSGMTPLLTAAHQNTNMTVIIVDNSTVAMTGTQESMSTGTRVIEIVTGLGVPREHIKVLNPVPKNIAENARILQEEVDYRGLSVIVAQRACLELR